jgi:hypothetical protein
VERAIERTHAEARVIVRELGQLAFAMKVGEQ